MTRPATDPRWVTKQDLPSSFQKLLELMQTIQFGRIFGLRIRCGEPVMTPPPKYRRRTKLAYGVPASTSVAGDDFMLKKEVRNLFLYIHHRQSGVIDAIEIKHGLPFDMDEECPSAGDGDCAA